MSKSTLRTILAVVVAVVVYTSYRYNEEIVNTLSNINFYTVKPISDREVVGIGDDMSLTGDMLTGDDMTLTGEDATLTGEVVETDMMEVVEADVVVDATVE